MYNCAVQQQQLVVAGQHPAGLRSDARGQRHDQVSIRIRPVTNSQFTTFYHVHLNAQETRSAGNKRVELGEQLSNRNFWPQTETQ